MTHNIRHEVLAELERAIRKFPKWPSDPLHALAILGEEYGELTKAVLQVIYEPRKATITDVREEAVQVAAMALRFIESLPVYDYSRAHEHLQYEVRREMTQAAAESNNTREYPCEHDVIMREIMGH